MNTRVFTVVTTLTLLTMSSGCSGIQNFLAGRGARCGLCNRQANPDPSPNYGPCSPQTPYNSGVSAAPGCGCNAGGMTGYAGTTGTCGESYGSAYGSGCGCGTGGNYTVDPYSSGDTGSMPYEGQIIYEGAVGNGTTVPDTFVPRGVPSQ